MNVTELIMKLKRYNGKKEVKVLDITRGRLIDIEEVAENVVGGDVVIWCED